jgi:hypothetical protein
VKTKIVSSNIQVSPLIEVIFRINFNGKSLKKILFVYGNQVCPRVSFSATSIDFMGCVVKEEKVFELFLTNKTEGLPVKVGTGKDSFLVFSPSKFIIAPLETVKVLVKV